MTEPTKRPAAAKTTHRSRAWDGVMLAAFVIFAGAMGGVLHVVLEVEPEMAALAALSTLSVLVAINAVVRRASLVASLDAEIADLKSELANLKNRPQPRGFADRTQPELAGPVLGPPAVTMADRPAPAASAPSLDAASRPLAEASPLPRMPARAETHAPVAHAPMPAELRAEMPPPLALGVRTLAADAPLPAPGAPRDPAMSPYWAVRPGTRREPQTLSNLDGNPIAPIAQLPTLAAVPVEPVDLTPAAEPAATPAPSPPAPTADAARISDGIARPLPEAEPAMPQWPQAAPRTASQPLDLGTMQSLIEQLALQLNQPRMADDEPEAVATAGPAPASADAAATPILDEIPRRAPDLGAHPNWQASSGIGGRTAVRRLPIALSSPAPLGRLALIAEAVEANRMDVYLDPILGLADRKARHFELSVRLRTETGEELEAGDYMGPAGGTGLLGRIDQTKLARATEVAQRLKLRGSHAQLFSNIAGESLADETFIGAFADILDAEDGLGAKLGLTFTQADARAFTAAHWDTISTMSEIGLKFALEDVRDLDIDFALLRGHGFGFVKLDAAVFLDGLPTPSGHIPAVDICRHLSELGLAVIIGGIVAERDLAKILGFGALLGQGALFGAPRSVQLDVERRAA